MCKCYSQSIVFPILILDAFRNRLWSSLVRSLFCCVETFVYYKWARKDDKHQSIFGRIFSLAYFDLIQCAITQNHTHAQNKSNWCRILGKIEIEKTRKIDLQINHKSRLLVAFQICKTSSKYIQQQQQLLTFSIALLNFL